MCAEASRCWVFTPFVVSAAPPTLKPPSSLSIFALPLFSYSERYNKRKPGSVNTYPFFCQPCQFFFLFFEDAATENHSALTPPMVFKILEKVVAEVFLLDVAADV